MNKAVQPLIVQLELTLSAEQITALAPLTLKATKTKSIICGSVDIEKKVLKLAAVDRETALEIEKLADTRGEQNAEEEK